MPKIYVVWFTVSILKFAALTFLLNINAVLNCAEINASFAVFLKEKKVDFKFDGEMQPDVALDEKYRDLYPFSEIVGNANVLVMPGRHSAAISFKLMKSLSAVKVVGPLLIGLGEAIEIAPLRSSTSDILNLASIADYSSEIIDYKKKRKN